MRIEGAILWLAACFVLAFLFAVVWVVVMTCSLPITDEMHGQRPFEDSLVFPIMSMFASISAIVVYPFTYFSLRDRPLVRSSAILATIVLCEVVVVTPMSPKLGFLGSFVAYAIGLIAARALTQRLHAKTINRSIQFSLRSLVIMVSCFAVLIGLFAVFPYRSDSRNLIDAAYSGDLQRVRKLIENGADVNTRDGWSGTPLMYAASKGNLAVVKQLLEAGADINERSRMDRTPIIHAARAGHLSVVEYLASQGAIFTSRDANGKSALDLASEAGYSDIVTYLNGMEQK